MPTSIIAALGTIAVGLIEGAAIGTLLLKAAITIGISLVLGAVSKALTPKPKSQDLSYSARDRTVSVRQPITAHRLILGQVRVGGAITFLHSVNGNNDLWLIVTLARHEVAEIGTIYFNEEEIPVNESTGAVTGKYAGYAWIWKHRGEAGQQADANLMAAAPDKWTEKHYGGSVAYLCVKLVWNASLWINGIPNITAIVKGLKLYDPRSAATGWTDNAALALANYLNSPAYGVGAGWGAEIDADEIAAAANVCDELVARAEAAANFTADAAADTVTVTAIEGEKPVRLLTGTKVQVSSDGALPAGLAAATDYYWILQTAARGKLATSLANARAGTAIDITDAGSGLHTITVKAEPRYTANGVIESDVAVRENAQALLTAMGGHLNYAGGAFRILAAAWRPAVAATLTVDDLRGGFTVDSLVGRRESFNAVKGVFVDPFGSWQPTDLPALTNQYYQDQDQGERVFKDVNLPFTVSAAAGQRLMKIELERARQQLTVTVPCKLTALRFAALDTVPFTYARFGWTDKAFELRQWAFAVYQDANGLPALGVDLVLRETAAAVFDWADGEETAVDLAPNTTLPDPFSVGAPANLQASSGDEALLLLGEGSVLSRIRATWDDPANAFVVATEFQYKRSADTDWQPGGEAPAAQLQGFVAPVEDGVSYDLRARFRTDIGVTSADWATVNNHVVEGKTALPPAALLLTVTRLPDGTRKIDRTMASVPADVRAGGGWRLRWYLGTTSDWSAMTPLNGADSLIQSFPFFTPEPLAGGTYTFAIRTVDSSGNESAATFTTVTLGKGPLGTVIYQQDEHALLWPGTKTDCYVHGASNALRATAAQAITDLPATISALAATMAAMVTRDSPFTYETAQIDLGSDLNWTATASVEGDGTPTVEMKTGTAADGGVVGAYGALGSVTGKRYVKFRISMAGSAPVVRQASFVVSE